MDKLNFKIFYDPYYRRWRPHAEIIINGQKLSKLLGELPHKLYPLHYPHGYDGYAGYAGFEADRLLLSELTLGKKHISILGSRDWVENDCTTASCDQIITENSVIWNNFRCYCIRNNLQFEFDKEQYKKAIKKLISLCFKEYWNFKIYERRQGVFLKILEAYLCPMEFSEDFLDMKRKKQHWKHGDSSINQWNEERVDFAYRYKKHIWWRYGGDFLIEKLIEYRYKHWDCFANKWNEQPNENEINYIYNLLINRNKT